MEIPSMEKTKLIQEDVSAEKNKEEYSILKAREDFPKYEKQQQAFSIESAMEIRFEFIQEKATESKPEKIDQIYSLDLSYKPKRRWAESYRTLSHKSELSNDVSFQLQSKSNDNRSEISNIDKISKSMPSEERMVRQKKHTEIVLLKRSDSNEKGWTSEKIYQIYALDLSYKPKRRWAESYRTLSHKSELSNDVSFKLQSKSNDNRSEISNINKISKSMPSEERMVRQKKLTEIVLLKRSDSNEKGWTSKIVDRSYHINQASANISPPVKNTISSNTSLSDTQENECSIADSIMFTKSSELTKQTEKVKQFKGFYKQKSVKLPISSKIGINYHSEPEPNLDFENNSIQKTDCSQFLLKHNNEKEREFLEDEPPILVKYNEECTHEDINHDPPTLHKYYDHSPEEVLSLTEYSPVYSKKDQANEKRKPRSQEVDNLPGTSIGIYEEHRTDGYNIKSFVDQFGTFMAINSEPNKSNSSKRTTVIVSPLILKDLPHLGLSSPMTSTYGSISNPQNNSLKTENLTQVVTLVNFNFNLNFESDKRAIYIRDINDRFLHDNCTTRTMRLRPYFAIIGNTNEGDNEEFCIEEILCILYYYRREFLRNGLRLGRSFRTILPVMPISCHITSDNDYELVGDDLKQVNERNDVV